MTIQSYKNKCNANHFWIATFNHPIESHKIDLYWYWTKCEGQKCEGQDIRKICGRYGNEDHEYYSFPLLNDFLGVEDPLYKRVLQILDSHGHLNLMWEPMI